MKNVIRISDGLGNQLFQYAFGYSVFRKSGIPIVLDPSYVEDPLRHYQLMYFNCDFRKKFLWSAVDRLLSIKTERAGRYWCRFREVLVEKLLHSEIVREKHEMTYDAEIYREKGTYYWGFWQSYKYFDAFYEDIKRQFCYNNSLSKRAEQYLKEIYSGNSVSLHIRRTDYVRNENSVNISFDFYEMAISGIQKELGNIHIYLFTDDIQFVKEHFKLHEYTLIDEINDLEAFVLMQNCSNHIIANSTFSWWAAYLSKNKGGIVYAPIADAWTRDFYPEEWHCIPAVVGN